MKDELRVAIDEGMSVFRSRHTSDALTRIDECVRIMLGDQPLPPLPALQAPALCYFPGLGAKPWYEPSEYDDLAALVRILEREYPRLRAEFLQHVDQEHLLPYQDQFPTGRFPGIQRSEWGMLYLQQQFTRFEENCARCPVGAEILDTVAPFLSPGGAFRYSVIGPHTRVPLHSDPVNTKLTCQLALVVPPGCGIRVGGEERAWEEGKCLIFDDTFAHEVWNQSDVPRVCLLLDIWKPQLAPVEREVIAALSPVIGEFASRGFAPSWAAEV